VASQEANRSRCRLGLIPARSLLLYIDRHIRGTWRYFIIICAYCHAWARVVIASYITLVMRRMPCSAALPTPDSDRNQRMIVCGASISPGMARRSQQTHPDKYRGVRAAGKSERPAGQIRRPTKLTAEILNGYVNLSASRQPFCE
jgi:hypothetical protein